MGQNMGTMVRTVTFGPENGGTEAPRNVAAMHPPTGVPAKGGPLTVATVTRPEGAKVMETEAFPLGPSGCLQLCAADFRAAIEAEAAALSKGAPPPSPGGGGVGTAAGVDGFVVAAAVGVDVGAGVAAATSVLVGAGVAAAESAFVTAAGAMAWESRSGSDAPEGGKAAATGSGSELGGTAAEVAGESGSAFTTAGSSDGFSDGSGNAGTCVSGGGEADVESEACSEDVVLPKAK